MKNDANTGQEFESPVCHLPQGEGGGDPFCDNSEIGDSPHKALPSNGTRKVIIRGHVFDYEEKAPFVTSGKSVLGALEYDFQRDRVMCHECGDWFTSIASHLSNGRGAHGDLTVTEYKKRHGINLHGSGLIAIGMRMNLKASLIVRLFGDYSSAMEEAGLIPNAQGYKGRRHSRLPENFPTKEYLLETRMPWPKDYFGVHHDQGSRVSE